MEARIGGRELGADVRERILRAAGGNPLFVEEMAAMVQASGNGEVEVPPTLQALLAARLDQLDRTGAVRARARLRRRRGLPPRSRPGAHPRGAAAHEPADRARPQGADPPRPAAVRRRGRVPLPSSPHARRGLRGPAEGGAGGAARAVRRLARRTRRRARRARRAARLPPRAGLSLPAGARAARRARASARRPRRRAARGSQGAARSSGRTFVPRSTCSSERPACCPTSSATHASRSTWAGRASTPGRAPAACCRVSPTRPTRAAAAGNRVAELGLRLDHAGYQVVFEPTDDDTARQLRELASRRCRYSRPQATSGGSPSPAAARLIAEQVDSSLPGRHGRCGRAGRRACTTGGLSRLDQLGRGPAGHAQDDGATPVEECLRWLDEHPEVERRSVLPYRDRLLAMLGHFDEAHRLLAEAADRAAELGSVRFRTWLASRRFEVAMLEGDAARAEVAARETLRGARSHRRARQLHVVLLQPRAGAHRARPGRGGRAVARTRARDRPERGTPPADAVASGAWQAARAARRARRRASSSRARRSRSPQRRTC